MRGHVYIAAECMFVNGLAIWLKNLTYCNFCHFRQMLQFLFEQFVYFAIHVFGAMLVSLRKEDRVMEKARYDVVTVLNEKRVIVSRNVSERYALGLDKKVGLFAKEHWLKAMGSTKHVYDDDYLLICASDTEEEALALYKEYWVKPSMEVEHTWKEVAGLGHEYSDPVFTVLKAVRR